MLLVLGFGMGGEFRSSTHCGGGGGGGGDCLCDILERGWIVKVFDVGGITRSCRVREL